MATAARGPHVDRVELWLAGRWPPLMELLILASNSRSSSYDSPSTFPTSFPRRGAPRGAYLHRFLGSS